MKALFAVSSLGLWHATRSLTVIKHYLKKGYKIDIISYWNALNYLKKELEEHNVWFFELKDYPELERWFGLKFYVYLILDLIKTGYSFRKENLFVKKISKEYNFIFSDGRYWIYDKNTPSFLLSHQLSFSMPNRLLSFQYISDLVNQRHFKKFQKIFVPDYKDVNQNLAGKLSHPRKINKINHKYIWILSDFHDWKDLILDEKIDYLFTITGYLLKQKKSFLASLLEEAKKLKWKKVFILGDISSSYKKELENNITVYSYLSSKEKKKFFNSADVIISRTGYTTIMDLVELEKKAILFPTPNQTEQEYLADYLLKKELFVIGNDPKNLQKLIDKVNNIGETSFDKKTKESLILINEDIRNVWVRTAIL